MNTYTGVNATGTACQEYLGTATIAPIMINTHNHQMKPGRCDTKVFSVFQNQIPIDGGSIFLYQIPSAVVHTPAPDNQVNAFEGLIVPAPVKAAPAPAHAMGLIIPAALASGKQAWTTTASPAVQTSNETLMGIDQKGNTCFEFIGPKGLNPIMLNTHDRHMSSGKCDRSVFPIFQDKIPSQGGYFMLYQKPKPTTTMILLI